jgi:hypothetical protein
MDDRKLIELAAKAAGIKLHVWGTKGKENFADMNAGPYGQLWNPLTDDGDALRLAVKLQIDLRNTETACTAISDRAKRHATEIHEGGLDPNAATRRAIVRAAAAIANQGDDNGS